MPAPQTIFPPPRPACISVPGGKFPGCPEIPSPIARLP